MIEAKNFLKIMVKKMFDIVLTYNTKKDEDWESQLTRDVANYGADGYKVNDVVRKDIFVFVYFVSADE